MLFFGSVAVAQPRISRLDLSKTLRAVLALDLAVGDWARRRHQTHLACVHRADGFGAEDRNTRPRLPTFTRPRPVARGLFDVAEIPLWLRGC